MFVGILPTTRLIIHCNKSISFISSKCNTLNNIHRYHPIRLTMMDPIRFNSHRPINVKPLNIPTPNYNPSNQTWIQYLPIKLQPYAFLMRSDKPAGTWLLYLPCTWSICMTSYALQTPPSITLYYLALFGLGSLIMRGAGCTINDLWDRNLDKLVARTKSRPLSCGTLTPFQAITFLAIQLSLGLCILTQLNQFRYFFFQLYPTTQFIVFVWALHP